MACPLACRRLRLRGPSESGTLLGPFGGLCGDLAGSLRGPFGWAALEVQVARSYCSAVTVKVDKTVRLAALAGAGVRGERPGGVVWWCEPECEPDDTVGVMLCLISMHYLVSRPRCALPHGDGRSLVSGVSDSGAVPEPCPPGAASPGPVVFREAPRGDVYEFSGRVVGDAATRHGRHTRGSAGRTRVALNRPQFNGGGEGRRDYSSSAHNI